jgi:hypothetical protein
MPVNLSIDDTIGFNHLSTNIREDIEVKVITLEEVMKYVKDPYLIKMDCEGCEYEVINHSFNILTKFKYILLEYHNADISERRKTLENSLTTLYVEKSPTNYLYVKESRI